MDTQVEIVDPVDDIERARQAGKLVRRLLWVVVLTAVLLLLVVRDIYRELMGNSLGFGFRSLQWLPRIFPLSS